MQSSAYLQNIISTPGPSFENEYAAPPKASETVENEN